MALVLGRETLPEAALRAKAEIESFCGKTFCEANMFDSRKTTDPGPRSRRRILRAFAVSTLALPLIAAVGSANASTSAGVAPVGQIAAAVAANQAPTSAAAIVSRSDGSDVVFYRGQDDAVYQRIWSGTGWSAQTSLGGKIVGAPAAAWAGSTLVLVGRGTTGALYMRTLVGTTWSPWQSLGGIVSASPAVTGGSDGRIDVFVRGSDDRMYTNTRPAGGTWSGWSSLGGVLTTGPGAVALGPSTIDVYVAGTDHRIYRNARTSAGWSGWSSIGGMTYTAPAAARIPGTSLARVFVRGTTNFLYINQNSSSGWSGWSSLGGVLIDAPGATATPTGVDIVVRGTTNGLYARSLRNGVWSSFALAWNPAPAPAPASSLLGVDWTRIPTGSKVVALTFDAGANAAGLASIRATLERKNVPATFFLTGSWVRSFPAQANEVAVGGFRVGNHSDTHPHFTDLTDAQVQIQVNTAQRAILLGNGIDSHPLFRFPYGDVNSRVLSDVNRLGYVAVRWTVDSLGWQGTSGGQTTQKVINRVLAAAQPGEIVLMHVGSNPDDHTTLDASALPQIIDGLRAMGYQFVTLQALTG